LISYSSVQFKVVEKCKHCRKPIKPEMFAVF